MAREKPWIRLYTEVVDDPKVQTLPLPLFKFWVNCLCFAGRCDGWLPPDDHIAWKLREPPSKITTWRKKLIDVGLIDETVDGGCRPHKWSTRQYETDVSTHRVRDYRERHKKRSETASETVSETVSNVSETVSGGVPGNVSPLLSVSVSGFKKLATETKTNIPPAFHFFWNRWCELTKRKQREGDACQAWLSVVETEEQAQNAMACLERYGASSDVANGAVTNPDKWLYEQARDGWRGDWQPPRNKRDADETEVARKMGMIE